MASVLRRKEGKATPTLHISASVAPIRYDGIFVRITVSNYEVILSPAEIAEAMQKIEAGPK